MKIDKETVEKVASLARLEIAEDEQDKMIADMNKILGFMDKLNEMDTSGVEPLIYMTDEINDLRKDEVNQQITTAEALQNAPMHTGDYILVAKVIEK